MMEVLEIRIVTNYSDSQNKITIRKYSIYEIINYSFSLDFDIHKL